MNRRLNHWILCGYLTISLAACGGGGGGGDEGSVVVDTDGVIDVVNGDVGGTGIGTITGFGSVIVNDIRRFTVNSATSISIDDDEVSESDLREGMVVRFDISDDANGNFTAGTAVNIAASNRVKGPISATNPLSVLGQLVVVTGSTVLDSIPDSNPANLALGDIVEVAGFADQSGVIQAARLEYKPGGVALWKVLGNVSNLLNNTSFSLGALDINLNGTVPRDCTGGLQNGDFVEVKATADSAYRAGDSLGTVTSVECQTNALAAPLNSVATRIEGEFEGFVTAVTSASEFQMGQQRVVYRADTEFEGGNASDIAVGVKLEAEGDFDTGTGILTADKIRFRETRVRIEAPLDSASVVPGVSLEIMGIRVIFTSQTEDDDGILASGSGIRQVEVRGFVDAAGVVIAEQLRDRGTADSNGVRVRGPVSTIVPTTFEILGLGADTATARSITDSNDSAIDSDTFFSLISNGTPVEIEDARWDGVSRLDNGKISIED